MSKEQHGAGPVNGFSVDVEDWSQVADFGALVARDAWDGYESRVTPTPFACWRYWTTRASRALSWC